MNLEDRDKLNDPEPGKPTIPIIIVLLLTLATSFFVYQKNSAFRLGYHADEIRKVRSVDSQQYEFRHPLVLIRSLQIAGLVVDTTSQQETVELGRKVSALYGTLYVLACFLLFREVTDDRNAILSTIVAAFVPNIVVHAHYLKEDIYLIPFLLLSLRSLIRYLRSSRRRDLVMMGVFCGLAGSTKYLGLAMLVFFLFAPRMIRVDVKKDYPVKMGTVVTPIVVLVFFLINLPVFWNAAEFFHGFSSETYHAARGHRLDVFPWSYFFLFHFKNSLIPGMGWSLVFPAILAPLVMWWRKIPFNTGERVLLAAGIAFYILIETSPLKPWPDFMRYAIPLMPILAYFAVRGVTVACEKAPNPRIVSLALLCFLTWLPFTDSWKLVRYLEDDTRARLAMRYPDNNDDVFAEDYTLPDADGVLVTRRSSEDLQRKGTKYVLTSSFNYERYFLGESLRFQSPDIYAHAERYHQLFDHCPTEDLAPSFKTFAFSNPTIRIVNFAECSSELSLPKFPLK